MKVLARHDESLTRVYRRSIYHRYLAEGLQQAPTEEWLRPLIFRDEREKPGGLSSRMCMNWRPYYWQGSGEHCSSSDPHIPKTKRRLASLSRLAHRKAGAQGAKLGE